MITISHLNKHFLVDEQEIIALHDVSFEIADEQFTTIIGPSGCGKSTLLRIIAGLEKQDAGELAWDKKDIGFVFQYFALFPYLTVLENIAFGLRMQGVGKKKRDEIAKELALEVGLSGFEDKHPKELSGGMKQRVGIARALAVDPKVLLLDEPFSSLDEFTAENLRKLLLQIWQKRKMTVVMVTHLVREALELSDTIVVMTQSPGKVETIVENKLKRPRNLRSKEFFALEDKLTSLIKV